MAQAVEVGGNFRVVATLLDAVNGLSPDFAAQVVPQVMQWLQVPMLTLVDDKATLLVERLHDAGFKTEATEIAITLFDSQLGLRGGV